jgi:small subunit ribosomal protein S5
MPPQPTQQTNQGGPARGGFSGGPQRGGPGGPGGRGGFGRGPQRGGNSRGPRRDGGDRFAKKDDFKEKVLDLRRVTRVVAGGKRFRFRATVIIGDEKGRVGVGVAKGLDVQSSVSKAKLEAKKTLIVLNLKDGRTIHHEVEAKYSAARVLIKPSSEGHGLKAGGSVRFVLALAGIKDCTAKVLGRTPNKLTNALATIEALKKVRMPAKKEAVK